MDVSQLRLFDNTRISDFRRCPRYFFHRHVRHWATSGRVSDAIAFGSAWHAAMDTIWSAVHADMTRDDTIDAALAAWTAAWCDAGMPHPHEIDAVMIKALGARNPYQAHEMLIAYYEKRNRAIRSMEIIEIERPFAVPLTPDDPTLFYVGRIDKVVAPTRSSVRGIEHKTTSSSKRSFDGDTKIRPMFMETFSPNSQVDGYLYTLHMLYPDKDVDVWVDAALVSTSGEDFSFIPVERKLSHLDGWLWTTHYWIERIEEQRAALDECGPEDPYLAAFPQDTSSCFDFNTQCPFLPLCKSRANPLTWEEPPGGFKVEKWDPLEHIGTPVELT